MNFFNLLTGGVREVTPLDSNKDLNLDFANEYLIKNGILVVSGKANNLKKAVELIRNDKRLTETNLKFYLFAILGSNFPKSGIVIPLVSPKILRSALQQLLLYKGKPLRNKLKIRILMILSRKFLYNLIFRRQILIIVDLAKDNLFSFLNRQLSLVNNYESNVIFSIYAGSRKFILPLFRVGNGENIAYTKVYFTDSKDSGENEVRVLRHLEKLDFSDTYKIPKVIYDGSFGDFFVEVLSTTPNLKNIKTVTPFHVGWLKELTIKTGCKNNFEDSLFYNKIKSEVDFIKLKASYKFHVVEYFYKQALENLSSKEFLFSLTMREFPYFHALKWRKGLFMLDWEQAQFDYPPIFDLFSLFLSGVRGQKCDFIEKYERQLKETFFQKNKNSIYISEALKVFQLAPKDAFWFFWLFIIDTLYIHLRDDHYLSATKVTYFLESAYKDKKFFKNNWLGSGLNYK